MSKIKIKQNAFDGLNYNESVNLYFEKKGEYEIQKENKMKELLPQKIDPSTKKKNLIIQSLIVLTVIDPLI